MSGSIADSSTFAVVVLDPFGLVVNALFLISLG